MTSQVDAAVSPRGRTTTARALEVLGPDGTLTIVAVIALVAVSAALGGALRIPTDSVVPFAAVGAALLGATAIGSAGLLRGRHPGDRARFVARQLRAIRLWAPFTILYLCYRGLRGVLLLIPDGAGRHDALLALDEALVGESPAWTLARIATPWLTELMAIAYAMMFVWPLAILAGLHARGRDRELRGSALALLIAFYLGFVIFLLVPAKSPDVVYAFDAPLRGHGFYEASTAAWARLQQVTFDAFPSMHTTISTIAAYHAHHHGAALLPAAPRLPFVIVLPAVVLLQIATLYLRQHYLVDVFAGWALAALALWLAARLEAAWRTDPITA